MSAHSMTKPARGALALALCLGLTAPSLAQNANQPRQAAKPAAAAPQAQAQPPFANIAQVCQMREREIVMVNSQLLIRNQALARETDQAKRAQIQAPVDQLRANLRETEASWQRMECVRLLYGRQ